MQTALPPFGDRRRRRIGLLGGSFNPAHDGHVHISREAVKRLGLDRVWWLVSPQNPLKTDAEMAPLADRMARARAVTTGAPIVVTDVERRLGVTHTTAVLRRLRQRYPRICFVWLMGADNLAQIPRWWRWTRIFHTTRVAVLDRSPYSYRALYGAAALRFRTHRIPPGQLLSRPAPAWSYLAIRRHPASATKIRHAAKTR